MAPAFMPDPDAEVLVVDLSGGATGVTAQIPRDVGQIALDPAVTAAIDLASAGGHTQAPARPVVVVITTPGSREPSQREEQLARTVRRLERKLQALSRERASAPPQPSRQASPGRPAGDRPAIRLSAVEERELRALAGRRSAPADARRRARIVLATARGLDTMTIARRIGVHRTTVRRWQLKFVEQRLTAITGPVDGPAAR